MEIQQQIAWKKAERMAGRDLEVMIEGRLADQEGTVYVGRTYMDAPDVDGLIYIDTRGRSFMTGDIVHARVTAAHEYDLVGEITESINE